MTKHTTAALAIAALALAPLTAFAFADQEEVENYCSQEAKGKGVAKEKVADFIADCVATNMKAENKIEDEGDVKVEEVDVEEIDVEEVEVEKPE
jgi:hypothetical protein